MMTILMNIMPSSGESNTDSPELWQYIKMFCPHLPLKPTHDSHLTVQGYAFLKAWLF